MIQIDFNGFSQALSFNGNPFRAKIFDGRGDDPPSQFNGVCLALDLSDTSSLDWKTEIDLAREWVKKGLFILWDLRFSPVEKIYDDEVSYLARSLAVQHFNEEVLKDFASSTLGVIFYRGKWDTNHREKLLPDLKSLAAILPDEIGCFLLLDTTECQNPTDYFSLICHEAYGHFKLALMGPYFEKYPYAVAAFGWDNFSSPLGYFSNRPGPIAAEKRLAAALCLPQHLPINIELEREIPFRVIPEMLLDQEWEGIEELIILPSFVSERGWRKIKGFIAAGGTVIHF